MTASDAERRAAATKLAEAMRTKQPCAPIRFDLPDADVDDAYAIQQLLLDLIAIPGQRRVGRKIGLTAPAVQRQMGVNQPDFGVLSSDMAYGDSQPVPFSRLLQPRAEVEVAFVLASGLDRLPVTTADVLAATAFVAPAIEIVDSRVRDWDIGIVDTVADNASAGLFVLGNAPRTLAETPDLRACVMQLRTADTVLSEGTGAACLGHPVNAVAWLANEVGRRGAPLEAGEIVLSGALGPLVPLEAKRTYDAEISGLGRVSAVIGD